jgi:hypothetical protein
MKKILFVFFCSLMSVMLHGQGLSVSADRMNVAYVGIDNPMTIVAEGYNCEDILASCDNGTLSRTDGCHYMFSPEKAGVFEIAVSAKSRSGTRTVGTVKYRVKTLPVPVALLAGKADGITTVGNFKIQMGVIARFDCFEFDAAVRVTQFKMEIKRGKEIIQSLINVGAAFDEHAKDVMKEVQPGDEVFITEIKCLLPGERTGAAQDVHLVLN